MSPQTIAELNDWLDRSADRLQGVSFRRPLEAARALLVGSFKSNIAQSSAPDGKPYAPLKARYGPRARPGVKPLWFRGRLIGSLTGIVTGETLVAGTNLVSETGFPFPAALQEGTAQMEGRPFVGLTAEMEARVAGILWAHAEKEMTSRGQ